ncbi:type VII secretion protein EssA [Neobacillus sp. SuZ13]|uniref:type VII secretion protein EssA n=1 Tax=Neobacillus sp. SuZ13 TaxID=3047875 RepID=UPI0024C08955|nr:type VII secretion protein EssA [Neobacillus sp. SuZ13]WHY67409.1 type VII secretion protein EssA [Neobacillus sp. SuZ13]
MKELVKLFSVITVFIGFLFMFSFQPLADETLDHSGKIQLQTDRIGQDAIDREKLETQGDQVTELEKLAPGLFKEQTQDALKTKQLELEQSTLDLQQGLFVAPSKPDITLKNTEKVLFSSNYTVQQTPAPTQNEPENQPGDFLNAKTITTFLGMVVLGCGGIFTMMRKTLG